MKNLIVVLLLCSVAFISCKREVTNAVEVPCEYNAEEGVYYCEGQSGDEAQAATYCVYEILSSTGSGCIPDSKNICLACTNPCARTVKNLVIGGCTYELMVIDRSCRKCPDGSVVAKIVE